jgi:hypothetical protein
MLKSGGPKTEHQETLDSNPKGDDNIPQILTIKQLPAR